MERKMGDLLLLSGLALTSNHNGESDTGVEEADDGHHQIVGAGCG